MKLAFIEAVYNKEITIPKDFLEKLPKHVILFASIQYHKQMDSLKEQIKDAGIKVELVRPKHAWSEGQLLGCGVEDWSKHNPDAFVYIGDGLFHPYALLFRNKQNVYVYDPQAEEQHVYTQKNIEQVLKRQKGAMSTFLMKNNIGVLITTKYGQSRLKKVQELEKKYPDKTFYYLLADNIDFNGLEDFPFIECFVNTACPRVMDDYAKIPKPVVNFSDIIGKEW